MCTCGIAIATQQATPAMQSSACACPIEKPNGRVDTSVATPLRLGAACAAGGRGRSINASSGIVTTQNRPRPR